MENHPTRVRYDNPKMYRWKSWEAQTPFAPSFDVPVYVDSIDVEGLEDLLASKLPIEWTTYNIFDWDEDIIKSLADKIYWSYTEYINQLCYNIIPKDRLWIRGWGVTLNDDEGIDHHSHAFHENTYLSGNICLSDLDSSTDYYFPYLGWYFDYWKVNNKSGNITLFPSWLEHKVDPNTTGQVRFSLAFDMFTEHTIDYVSNNRNNSSVLQNIIMLSERMDHV